MTAPTQAPTFTPNEQEEFTEELLHWSCSVCYPLVPARALCGSFITQNANQDSEDMGCVVCDYMMQFPCEGCGQ